MPFHLFPVLSKWLCIRGYSLFELSAVPEVRAQAEHYIFEHIQNNSFKPIIARTFTLDNIVEAHRMESNEQVGKITVTV